MRKKARGFRRHDDLIDGVTHDFSPVFSHQDLDKHMICIHLPGNMSKMDIWWIYLPCNLDNVFLNVLKFCNRPWDKSWDQRYQRYWWGIWTTTMVSPGNDLSNLVYHPNGTAAASLPDRSAASSSARRMSSWQTVGDSAWGICNLWDPMGSPKRQIEVSEVPAWLAANYVWISLAVVFDGI